MKKYSLKNEFRDTLDKAKSTADKAIYCFQMLAIHSLKRCKSGNADWANLTINTVHDEDIFDVSLLIKWFEDNGKLKWSNKKGKLVFSDSGKWFSGGPIPLWINPLKSTYIDPGSFSVSKVLDSDLLEMENARNEISSYLKSHPLKHSAFGRIGVPASKNRWGKYKLKLKRK